MCKLENNSQIIIKKTNKLRFPSPTDVRTVRNNIHFGTQICSKLATGQWTVVEDPEHRMGPYAYRGNQWVGFDDIGTVRQKVGVFYNNRYERETSKRDSKFQTYDNMIIDYCHFSLQAEYVNSMNLGGAMVWALDLDDFRNVCGQGNYPLLGTLMKTLGHEYGKT